MKKYLLLTGLFMLLLVLVLSPTHIVSAKSKILRADMLKLLPVGTQVPDVLPAGITDPLLLAGWVYLYNQQEMIPTWDGHTMTGKMLAEYLRDQKVTVRWNTTTECSGYSCTARVTCDLRCKLGQSVRNPNPIMIATDYKDSSKRDLARLAGSLAHEAFHHMLPFGPGEDTLFEEYWAFFTGAYISRTDEGDFTGINPLEAACLKQFFSSTGRDYYNAMNAFPAAVATLGNSKDTICK
jgi:hypothetical protein